MPGASLRPLVVVGEKGGGMEAHRSIMAAAACVLVLLALPAGWAGWATSSGAGAPDAVSKPLAPPPASPSSN
jgi:hypothetical protein